MKAPWTFSSKAFFYCFAVLWAVAPEIAQADHPLKASLGLLGQAKPAGLKKLSRCFDLPEILDKIRFGLKARGERVRYELSSIEFAPDFRNHPASDFFFEGLLAAFPASSIAGEAEADDVPLGSIEGAKLFDVKPDKDCEAAELRSGVTAQMVRQVNGQDIATRVRSLENYFRFASPQTGVPTDVELSVYRSEDGRSGMVRVSQRGFGIVACPLRLIAYVQSGSDSWMQFNGESHWATSEFRYVWGDWQFAHAEGVPAIAAKRDAFRKKTNDLMANNRYGFWGRGGVSQAGYELFCEDSKAHESLVFFKGTTGLSPLVPSP